MRTAQLAWYDRGIDQRHSWSVHSSSFRRASQLILAVFVIRIAEKRIDVILDASMLDYETLEDFNDVRFEGEWSLFRSFGGKKQRPTILPKAPSVFMNDSSTGSASMESTASPGRFGSLRDSISAVSPLKTPSRQSVRDPATLGPPMSTSMDSLATVAANGLAEEIRPSNITDILSAVLLILQLYEVNPAMAVQAFSQIFFWIASELFNRLLTRKKYLCRSKAIQIRMNITVLEDWVRANGLPAKTAIKHLEPVTQLLQWLQCLSQIKEFDTLIGTMQNMKAINPLQMRRAVREYRSEVNEGKMTDECGQYLTQLQKDWERRKVQMARTESDGSVMTHDSGDQWTPIDALFDGTVALSDFLPQSAPECLGELIDSRFMLPFRLPSDSTYLAATPPTDTAFNALTPPSPFISDGSRTSQPPSRSSFSSARPMAWAMPNAKKLRELPPDFFTWLKDRKSEVRLNGHAMKPKELQPVFDMRRQGQPIVQTSITTKIEPLAALTEDEKTPLAIAVSYPSQGTGFPILGLRTSSSLELLQERARVPFIPVEKPSHSHSNSYELKVRSPVVAVQAPVEVDTPSRPEDGSPINSATSASPITRRT